MGNVPSKGSSSGGSVAPQSPSSSSAATSSHAPPHGPPRTVKPATQRTQPRRKESIHTLSATVSVKPSASLESATAELQSTSATTSASDRLRSQGIGQQPPTEAATPRIRPADSQNPDKMGGKESKIADDGRPRSPSRPTSPRLIERSTSTPTHTPTTDNETLSATAQSLPMPDEYSLPPSVYLSRPPRLPLPIEEEVYTPGSPVIPPQDTTSPVEPIESESELTKKTSMLSTTTADDEEIGDDSYLFQDSSGQPLVPTLIEWRQGGDKVYLTGTFVDWDKKVRLHRNGPSKHKDAFSAYINLPPGTHHCRFIVDGDLRLSEDLPTAVDFTNFLTNYIEVASPSSTTKPSVSVDIPSGKQPSQPLPAQKIEYRAPPGVHPPQILPPTPELVPVTRAPPPEKRKDSEQGLAEKQAESVPAKLSPGPPRSYHRDIPHYLLDLDAPDDSPTLIHANSVVNTLPSPPTLPMFLGKSILNGATPMKDDASVLIMPNHTVLNHLATSSIKNKVLATSATTRYKRKFLTTIMYKPTSETGD